MPGYNFMPAMVPKLMAGVKPTTIRALRKDGRVPRVGERFVAFTGMRSQQCRRLFESVTREVSPIVIRRRAGWVQVLMRYDGRGSWIGLGPRQIATLARRDGFAGVEDFRAFFLGKRRKKFTGHLITFDPPL
jgi:hypothetical protein